MGKKVFLIICLSLAITQANINQFGRIVSVSGNVSLKRSNELICPIVASRIYFNEELFVSHNSKVLIYSDFNNYIAITGPAKFSAKSPKYFDCTLGDFYIESIIDEEIVINHNNKPSKVFGSNFLINDQGLTAFESSEKEYQRKYFTESDIQVMEKPKSLKQALILTSVYPGAGHYYLENKPKAFSMGIVSFYILYNMLTINPTNWSSDEYREIMYNKKSQFQQGYLIYLFWALIDTVSETENYNKRFFARENNQLKINILNKEF